jgi:hypothetical protein
MGYICKSIIVYNYVLRTNASYEGKSEMFACFWLRYESTLGSSRSRFEYITSSSDVSESVSDDSLCGRSLI